MKLWVDVEDFFVYAHHVKRPSGIQRVAFELQRALVEIAPDSVQFIRHGNQSGSFVIVPFARIEALFEDLAAVFPSAVEAPACDAAPKADAQGVTAGAPPIGLFRRLRWRVLRSLPQPLRDPAARLWVMSTETVGAAGSFIKTALRRDTWFTEKTVPRPAAAEGGSENTFAGAEGDWLVVLGSPWSAPAYAAHISAFCGVQGLRFALLVYDIIPLRRPEWVDRGLRSSFYDWFHAVVPLAHKVLAISHATADDVERYERETRFGLQGPVRAIPLGTGFACPATPVRTRRLPPRRSYALIVSTIEIRKNHLLLFRIWRELTEQMPIEQVPTLVFAGRVGWLVQDLMQQLKNTEWLNGKIMMIDSPSDAELATLYEDCMFTVFPSLFEGWGLPVTESLAYGAPCISSNRTSLTEAGGDLAVYFDPDNLADAVSTVRKAIENPEALQAWRQRIAREFKAVSWTDSARAIIEELQNSGAVEAPQQHPTTSAAAD